LKNLLYIPTAHMSSAEVREVPEADSAAVLAVTRVKNALQLKFEIFVQLVNLVCLHHLHDL
jgi:hypothetical protein